MYPLAHIYFANRVLGFKGDAAALGSLFPDVIISSGLEWEQSHSLADIIWKHFYGENKNKVSFSLGVISHGVEPHGLDYYSDKKYKDFGKGYCYEKARGLIDEVVDSCYIAPEDGWWKAHNFVEMSVELFLYQKDPSILSILHNSLNNSPLIAFISKELQLPLGLKSKLLENSFSRFKRFAATKNIDARGLAIRFRNQQYFENNHDIVSMDLHKCQELIERGKNDIAKDIEDFFKFVQKQMEPVWKEYIYKNVRQ